VQIVCSYSKMLVAKVAHLPANPYTNAVSHHVHLQSATHCSEHRGWGPGLAPGIVDELRKTQTMAQAAAETCVVLLGACYVWRLKVTLNRV
jgi:hypothetical protein